MDDGNAGFREDRARKDRHKIVPEIPGGPHALLNMSHEGLINLRLPAGLRGPGNSSIIPEAVGGPLGPAETAPGVPDAVGTASDDLSKIDVTTFVTFLAG
eukprot:7613032-Alexandrium_andersonii.AAC.1